MTFNLSTRLSLGTAAKHSMAASKSILKRLVNQLLSKGLSESAANAVARKRLQEAGILKKNSEELTKYGKKRQEMGAAGRAKDRAARASGRPTSDYKYNARTNRATLKAKAAKKKK